MNSEQKLKEQALQAQGEQEFAEKLAQSMDLPSTLATGIEEHKKESEKPVVEEEVTEEELEKEETEQAEEPPQEEKPEESDEDLIPKSKVQKRFDEMTRENRELKSRLQKLEEQASAPKKDSEEEQLEKMTETELATLKRQVRVEQIKAGTDESKLSKLLDLEEKIDKTIRTAPQRFQKTQIDRFNSAVRETASSMEDFESVKTQIFNYAKTIYDSSPELQASPSGQERAWKFAVDHLAAVRTASEGKSDKTELQRQVNTLKKKISVDSSSKKTTPAPDSMERSFKKAVSGTETDKTNFLRKRLNTDSLVSDDELRNFGG